MFKYTYTDSKLRTKTQTFFLFAGGIRIKLTFKPSELIFFKKRMLKDIILNWGKAGFLTKKEGKSDFEIVFKEDTGKIKIFQNKEKHYYLSFIRHFKKRKVETFYHADLLQLQICLKEIFSYLLMKDNGFLLHGSGVIDKRGNLKLFLTRTGGGKTTLANSIAQLPGYKKFCDDVFIARKVENKWRYFSPPFIEKDQIYAKKDTGKAKLFFLKKAKKASISEFKSNKNFLKRFLEQIWLRENEISAKVLGLAMSFTKENEFFGLNTTLNGKEMEKFL